MKIGNLGLASVLALAIMMPACKKTPNTEPVADTETETAVDAAWMNYVVADIDQMAGFMGEDQFDRHFYLPKSYPANWAITNDPVGKQKAFSWINNNGSGPQLCKDGRKREGSIFLYYYKDNISNPNANENSRYYRDFGFVGNIAFQDYYIDGWKVELYDPAARMYVYNKLTTDAYDPSKTQLTWLIAGKLRFTNPEDPSKSMVWDGKLTKVLTNSTDPDIFAITKQKAINWYIDATSTKPAKTAILNYYGTVNGITRNQKPFVMTINSKTPLVRDFMCTADPVAAVTASAVSSNSVSFTWDKEEHHPIIAGIASFTTGAVADKIYPRQIYFGNEGSIDQPVQCDNTGVVMIQGNSYPVNFRK